MFFYFGLPLLYIIDTLLDAVSPIRPVIQLYRLLIFFYVYMICADLFVVGRALFEILLWSHYLLYWARWCCYQAASRFSLSKVLFLSPLRLPLCTLTFMRPNKNLYSRLGIKPKKADNIGCLLFGYYSQFEIKSIRSYARATGTNFPCLPCLRWQMRRKIHTSCTVSVLK